MIPILEGTPWTAQAYNNGQGDLVPPIEGAAITAFFEGGRVAGSAGCNSYFAPYSLAGSAIEIGRAACTRKACTTPPGIMAQEAAYLAALGISATYRIEGSRLVLESAAGVLVASFAPTARGPAHGARAKISFDLEMIDDEGLTGQPDGKVAVAYEFCIPETPTLLAEVQRIDPTAAIQRDAPGRIGCGPDQVLCIGSTHQPDWRSVLQGLAALHYVARIDRYFGE
jgi:heat shock protein HslJ